MKHGGNKLLSWGGDLGRYLVKAVFVLLALLFIEEWAPLSPAWLLPAFFLLYAAPAVAGSMYGIVINRLHRQDLYNENGTLSRYNRKWLVWFGCFFVLNLLSSVLYVVQSPGWGVAEREMIWASPLLYGVVYLIARTLCEREFSETYYKARAMRWSIVISAGLLTLFYAVMATQVTSGSQLDLHDIIQTRQMPLASSPAPLLVEMDKLSTYSNCLTEYGVGRLAGGSYAISLVTHIVTGFSIFAGVVSQFGACLLSWPELKSEFQLLPVEKDDKEQPVLKRYLVMLASIWIALSGVFVWLNCEVGKIQATSEYTAVDAWIDETSEWAVLVVEQDVDTINEGLEATQKLEAFDEEIAEKREAIENQVDQLAAQVNAYYDMCEANIGRYVEWYNDPFESLFRLLPFEDGSKARDEFTGRVITAVDSDAVVDQYQALLRDLKELYTEYWLVERIDNPSVQPPSEAADDLVSALPQTVLLDIDWEGAEGEWFKNEILLGDCSGMEERILNYIEQRRGDAIEYIESLPDRFLPENPE